MQVVRFSNLEPFAPLACQWDRLARHVPFRSWAWLSAWWRHYGHGQTGQLPSGSLYLLGVIDSSGDLAGIAPWYAQHLASRGRVLRPLGAGEVCSDYLSVLCQPEREAEVAEGLADWLMAAQRGQTAEPNGPYSDRWDLLELTAVEAGDTAVRLLLNALEARDGAVYCRPGPNCWRIELPDCWEHYLAMLSKDHRKQVRRVCQRLLATGRAVLHTVLCEEDLPRGQAILTELHRRRRTGLGQAGCFASARFAAFHRDVMQAMFRDGRLGLHWIELDGAAVAAEYQLLGDDVVYAYQSGIDPVALGHSPGTLAHAATIRLAIEQRRRGFDFLRGDEPYKAHWRAQPRAGLEIQVVPPRASARLRHGAWRSGRGLGRWLWRGWKRITGQPRRRAAGKACQHGRVHNQVEQTIEGRGPVA